MKVDDVIEPLDTGRLSDLGLGKRGAKLVVHEFFLMRLGFPRLNDVSLSPDSPAIELIKPSGLTAGPGTPSHLRILFTRW